MSRVFVIDQNHQPVMPCTPARARMLLHRGQAAVFRRFPFTIILKRAIPSAENQPLRLKIDPGSHTSGIAIVGDTRGDVVYAAEIFHRGQKVSEALDKRRALRRGRRTRKTRHRPVRVNNRRRPAGWLPPSLRSRVDNIRIWIERFRHVCPVTSLSQELVRFDTQALQQPEIAGVEYQQGTLMGYELREYLLEKWGRKCAYCGTKELPLQVEHLVPRARGGTNRVSNLTLACQDCNQRKGARTAEEFGYSELQAQAMKPLKGAAIGNATRWAIWKELQESGLPIEIGTGGRTKFNRSTHCLPKTHWLDAACVGASTPASLRVAGIVPLLIKATGRGSRQMCRVDRFGFPRTGPKATRTVLGMRTGDIARAVVTSGTKKGVYVGRVAIRATKRFNIQTRSGTIQGLPAHTFTVLHRSDGYSYQKGRAVLSPLASQRGS